MRVELPQFKRCCCCLPLRYGILVYGYLKLVFSILMMIPMMFSLVQSIRILMWPNVTFITVIIALLLLDMGLAITFVVGGHRKNAYLLRIHYIYCLVLLGLFTLLIVAHSIIELYFIGRVFSPLEDAGAFIAYITYLPYKVTSGIFLIGIQAYFILLIRSEAIKLKNNCEFRFENIASEAQCTMEKGPVALKNEIYARTSQTAAVATVTVTINDGQSEGATDQEDKGNFRYAKMTQKELSSK